MWENAYLSIKNPKASRALKRALDPGRKLLASLARLHFATSTTFGLSTWGPPLDQILDPHLNLDTNNNRIWTVILKNIQCNILFVRTNFWRSIICMLCKLSLQIKTDEITVFGRCSATTIDGFPIDINRKCPNLVSCNTVFLT